MADDTVEAARRALKERVVDRVIATTRELPTIDELIDAYAAAVRDEMDRRSDQFVTVLRVENERRIEKAVAAVRAENAPLLAACRAALDWTPLREDRDILLNAINKTR